MARGTGDQSTSPLIRGLEAEDSFRKLLGENATRANAFNDRFDHWDFNVKFDVKKIRSTDEFGESNYHWIELMNVNGNLGWLYGSADYFAFETKLYWLVVPAEKLREFIKENVKDAAVTFVKKPYTVYRRQARLDKVVMVPTLDLCFLSVMKLKA